MFWPDTQTGVDVEPARKTVQSAVRKYFTEGGVGVPPTVPGGDWFNQITNELLNVLAAAGIDPSKADDDQLLEAIKRVSNSTSAREALRRSYAEAGYTLVEGSFEIGGFFEFPTDVLLYEKEGIAYSYSGILPHEVYEGSAPTAGGFVPEKNEFLREQLSSLGSSIEDIAAFPSVAKHVGRDADVYDLIITYGQSNSNGEPVQSGDTSGFPIPGPRNLMYDFGDGTIKPIIQNMKSSSYGVGTLTNTVSSGHAWGEFGNEWYRQGGHGTITVMCGRGGMRLQKLSKGYTTGAEDYYGRLVSSVALAKARAASQGLTIGKTVVMFHQGESDQRDTSDGTETAYDSYVTMLTQLINDLNSDIGIDSFGLYVVGCPTTRPEYRWAVIQNAQRYVAQNGTTVVLAWDGCPAFNVRDGNIGTDGTHYTQKALNLMGQQGAINMWRHLSGAQKRKSSVDIAQYQHPRGSSYLRNSLIYAAATENLGSFVLRHRDTFDGAFRPVNVESVSVSVDGYALLFKISERCDCWHGFSAHVDSLGNTVPKCSRFSDASGHFIRVDFFADLVVGVRTDGSFQLFCDNPLTLFASASGIEKYVFTGSSSGGVATINHGPIKKVPLASAYADGSFTDSSGLVSVRGISQTQTKVAAKLSTNPVAIVEFKDMQLTVAQLISAYPNGSVLVNGLVSSQN